MPAKTAWSDELHSVVANFNKLVKNPNQKNTKINKFLDSWYNVNPTHFNRYHKQYGGVAIRMMANLLKNRNKNLQLIDATVLDMLESSPVKEEPTITGILKKAKTPSKGGKTKNNTFYTIREEYMYTIPDVRKGYRGYRTVDRSRCHHALVEGISANGKIGFCSECHQRLTNENKKYRYVKHRPKPGVDPDINYTKLHKERQAKWEKEKKEEEAKAKIENNEGSTRINKSRPSHGRPETG